MGVNFWRPFIAALGLSISACFASTAHAEQSCVYINERGEPEQVRNPQALPHNLRSRIVCKDKTIGEVVAPEELDVGRDARSAEFSTELGTVKVRWSRSIERCFTSNPARAVGDAARAVNRAIKNARFIEALRYNRREWSIGFVDKMAAISQFPLDLTLGRHPGFMIPPNRIYLISDYVAPDCGDHQMADDLLTQVLLHEMGHVVEYVLLGERQTPIDRARSEGFAVWFEQYSAEFASNLLSGQVKSYYAGLAQMVDLDRGFTPDPKGYAQAGLKFQTIVSRKGVSGLMSVYQLIREEQLPFDIAVERALSWNGATFERQVRGYLSREVGR